MKQVVLAAIGLLGCFSIAACHKAVPVAARVEPPAPAADASAPKPAAVAAQRPAQTAATANRRAEPRRSATMTPQERATLEERLAHLADALFDFDKYTIRSDATTALKDDVDVIRGMLGNYPSQKLVIEGHADERGSAEYNVALGDKRARAVDEFLSSMGVPKDQLTVISYGKDRPICTDQSEVCWQKNRRAHITAAR
jgi:peptidoglycan-associated lipoprotein